MDAAATTTEQHACVAPRSLAVPGLGWRTQAGIVLALALAGLVPALLNGMALVFPDTEGYLVSAQTLRPQHVRAFGYGAFLRLTGAMWSLWLPVVAQAVLAAWLVTRLLVLEAARLPLRWRQPAAWSMLAVVLLGHLPWIVAWVQPDLFTGLLVLAVYLLAMHWGALPALERAVLLVFALGAATTHLTHPPLLLGLGLFALVVLGLTALTGRARELSTLWRTAALALGLAVVGWGSLAGANWITYRVPTASLGAPVFLFSRLAADGDAAAALRPGCEAGRDWAVCAHLDWLRLPADEFLWRDWSPLPALGHTSNFMAEAAELNPILLRHDWPAWLGNSAVRTVQQLATVELGDGMDAEGPAMLVEELGKSGLEVLGASLLETRQAADAMRPLMPAPVAEALAAGGLASLAGLAAYGLYRRRPSLWWPALLLLACWLGNAGLIALAGEVHGRYSARLVWLAPLLAGLLALRAIATRDDGTSLRRAPTARRDG